MKLSILIATVKEREEKFNRLFNRIVSLVIDYDGVEVLISYSGTYDFEEGCVVHKVEISDNPKRVGTEQRRYIKLDGDLMTFTESPIETSFKIVWQKQERLSSFL